MKPFHVFAEHLGHVHRRKLRDVVNRTCGRGGRIIVPAFAVGRTQQLVLLLHQLANADHVRGALMKSAAVGAFQDQILDRRQPHPADA